MSEEEQQQQRGKKPVVEHAAKAAAKNTYPGVVWAEKSKNDIYFSQKGLPEGI